MTICPASPWPLFWHVSFRERNFVIPIAFCLFPAPSAQLLGSPETVRPPDAFAMVWSSIGDRGPFHYKKSRREDAEVDRAAAHVLKHTTSAATILAFSPSGYDERQYCSPGFNLPVGCLMRSVWGTFPEYHTSADNHDFLSDESLAESLKVCASIFEVLENNRSYQNLAPFCEPQLGRRGLYHSTGGTSPEAEITARLWVLNMSDGQHSLLDIAERSGLPFAILNDAAELLSRKGLLAPVDSPQGQA